MTERLLKTLGIAELLGVSPVTVKRWRAIGWGPPWIRLRGERGAIRYAESEYKKWVAENSNRSLADEYAKRPQDDPQQGTPSTPKATPTFSMKDGRRSVRRDG
jgi:predicted DNA-binding transcriptional regulator AlpA